MDMKEICPCPNLTCPNHGDCEKCISRHLRLGFLNYCAFHTFLPTLRQVIDSDPESPAAKKLDALIGAQREAYTKLMDKHGLSHDHQKELLEKVSAHSDH